MATEGWYYLHENGDLIYKGAAYTSVGDFRESDLVRAFWPVETGDREKAWNLLVEALAAGADPAKVEALAAKWGCDDADAQEYARRINVGLVEVEGGGWGAYPGDVLVVGESSLASVGATCLEAMAELAKWLGYRPSKMWGASFPQLVQRAIKGATPTACPTCGSPAPHRHPAVQFEGEVQPCGDPFHAVVTPQNTVERISATEALHDRAAS